MTDAMPYIFKPRHRHPVLVASFGCWYVERTKPGNKLGLFQTVVGTGLFDKSKFTLLPSHLSEAATVPATAAGVKTRLRRIRDTEHERVLAIDAEIKRLGQERSAILDQAWTKGHVVTLNECKAKADAILAKKAPHA